MADLIDSMSLGMEPPSTDGISLGFGDVTTGSNPVDPKVAEQRAGKWHRGLGENSPGADALYSGLVQGQESTMRQNQAVLASLREQSLKNRVIREHIDKNGGQIDKATVEAIQGMSRSDLEDPEKVNSYFESQYAKKVVTTAASRMGPDILTQLEDAGGKAHEQMDFAEKVLHVKEGAQKVLEDLEKRYKDQGVSSKILPNLERFVGPLFDYRSKDSFWSLKGNDHKLQFDGYYASDDPFKSVSEIRAKAEEIYQKNPEAALEWIKGVTAYSTSDRVWDNAFSVLGVLDVVPPAGLAAKATAPVRNLSVAMRDVVRAAGNRTTTASGLLQATGDFKGAALAAEAERLVTEARLGQEGVENPLRQFTGQTTTLHDPEAILAGTNNLSQRARDQIREGMRLGNSAIHELLFNRVRESRLDEGSLAWETAVRQNDNLFRLENPKAAANIADVRVSNLEQGLTSNRRSIFEIQDKKFLEADGNQALAEGGKDIITTTRTNHDLQPFPTAEHATRAAKEDFGFDKFDVVQKGNGYVIEVSKAIDETLPSVRNALRIDVEGNTNSGPIQQFLKFVTSKDQRLDEGLLASFKTWAYGAKGVPEQFARVAEPLIQMRKSAKASEWQDFSNFLERQRVHTNQDGSIGRFSPDQGGFEADWMRNYNRLPTEVESAAYWSYVTVSDVDWVLNNLGIYRDKLRTGLENFHFPYRPTVEGAPVNAKRPLSLDELRLQAANNNTPNGAALESQGLPQEATMGAQTNNSRVSLTPANENGRPRSSIEGKFRTEIPWGSEEPFTILRWNQDPNQIAVMGERTLDAINEVNQGLATGRLKAVQLSEAGERALRAQPGLRLPEGRIHFVLTDGEIHAANLDFQQIPYRPGGHHWYDYDWYVRQPNLNTTGQRSLTTYYRGDLNMYGARTEAEARTFTERMNVAREMLRRNDAGLDTYLANNLPYTRNDFARIFDTYNIDTPFYHTPANVNVDKFHKLEDVYKRTSPDHRYIRNSESEFNLYNEVNLKFASERNDPLQAIELDHSRANPTFQLRRAEMLDPVSAMDRAARGVMESVYLHDVKAKAVEQFIAEFSDLLKPGIDELRRNPLKALIDGDFKDSIDPIAKAAAKDMRRSVMELLHLKSDFQMKVDAARQHVLESLVGTRFERLDPYLTAATKDPIQFMRNTAFELKQGLGNVGAFINQALAVTRMAAIEGPERAAKAGIQSMYAGMLLRTTDDNIRSFWARKYADAFGGNPEHFLEALNALDKSKFGKVGREVADISDWENASVMQTGFGKFLDIAKTPFKAGEGVARYNAWFMSYDRWRQANPTARFNDAAIQQVLSRADMLNLNMSGVSNADWQKGLMAIPAQFLSAHLRAAEQWIRGNAYQGLTRAEMARVMAFDSMLFGLPTAAGGTLALGLWPVGDTTREVLKEKGIRPEDNAPLNILVNGLPSFLSGYVSEKPWDFSSKGLGGISTFRDLLTGNKDAVKILGGVSGSAMVDTLSATMPVLGSLLGAGTGDDSWYPLAQAHFMDAMRNVSSLSNAEKIMVAINRGKYVSKNGMEITDANGWQAMFGVLTGAQPMEISQMYAAQGSLKDTDKFQAKQRQEFFKNIDLALQSLNRDDDNGYKAFMSRAKVAIVDGGFRQDQIPRLYKDALDRSKDLVTRTEQRFANRVGGAEGRARFEAFIKFLKSKNQ